MRSRPFLGMPSPACWRLTPNHSIHSANVLIRRSLPRQHWLHAAAGTAARQKFLLEKQALALTSLDTAAVKAQSFGNAGGGLYRVPSLFRKKRRASRP